jgi:hypothetical protein
MPLGWLRRRLERWGSVTIRGHAIPSVWASQHVSERGLTGLWWRTCRWLEARHGTLSARLGCFVLLTVERKP